MKRELFTKRLHSSKLTQQLQRNFNLKWTEKSFLDRFKIKEISTIVDKIFTLKKTLIK